MLEIPAVEVFDLLEQDPATRAFRRSIFVFSDQIANPLRASQDAGMDRRSFIELEHLRHVANHEVAATIEFAGVGRQHACRDLEESRFAGTIAPDQSDPLTFQKSDRGLIEHDVIPKPDDQFGRARDGVWNGLGHLIT